MELNQNLYMNKKVNLSKYDNSWYSTGANKIKMILWYFTNEFFFDCGWNVSSSIKVKLLRLFGSKVGTGVVIKPKINIKYPWNLTIGNNCWLGEGVWIDNLAKVTLGDNVVVSQGAMLLCGNHNYKLETFDLIIGNIVLEDGAWVGAKATVCPGVTLYSHSVLGVGSVANHNLEPYMVYSGVPAIKVRQRTIA